MPTAHHVEHFYDQLTEIVDQSLDAVLRKYLTSTGNSALDEAITKSRGLLEKFREKTTQEITELRSLSEWETFTIAFYGETNAGKSTLIETLRILLRDNEKITTQQDFQSLSKELKVDPKSLVDLERSIRLLEQKLEEARSEASSLEKAVLDEEYQHHAKLQTLKAVIEDKRKNMNLWQRIVFFFKKLDEEKDLLTQEMSHAQLTATNKAKLETIASEPVKALQELNALRREQAAIQTSFAKLEPLQDGIIIGNGRSDFTRQSRAYRFMVGNQMFQIVDVPGIEGDEKQVVSSIDTTVKQAHVVFYVTRTASPPGSGSDGQEGTIDKIKRQLGKQTEVWAIYNKSATAPQVLQGETLINQSDRLGLEEMNKALLSTLGPDTYKGHICVSGMPAFLAAASCLLPHNPHTRSREKFLTTLSKDEILARSGVDSFVRFLRDEVCNNFKKKISDANLKKIDSCLQEGISQLNGATEHFVEAAKKLEKQQTSASKQIDELISSTSTKLKSACHDHLTSKKSAMRRSIYDFIDSNQSDDDFKERLTSDMEGLKDSIGNDLEKAFSSVFEDFKFQATEIIKKNQKNVDDILHHTIDDPFVSLKLNFTSDFRMDNGINMIGLVSSLGGAAALVWASFLASNPVGWTTAAVLGAVGLVFSLYKAVRSFFSSDYKKEQQRKSADENLDNVFEKLKEMLEDNLDSASAKISEALQDAKTQMSVPYEQCLSTAAALKGAATRMESLRARIDRKQALPRLVAA